MTKKEIKELIKTEIEAQIKKTNNRVKALFIIIYEKLYLSQNTCPLLIV